VPWPPGFREEINAWAKGFLGGSCLVKPGEALVVNNSVLGGLGGAPTQTIVVHPETYGVLRNIR
jgi:hypothetical protein